MDFPKKIRSWLDKNKKELLIGGSIVLFIVGTGIGCVMYKNNHISFPDWLKIATKEELDEVYEKLRLEFYNTGIKTYEMQQISHELELRGAKEWFEKHPPNLDPNYRWTDANRWD